MKLKKKVLFVLGTRPEAIKLAPVIKEMHIDPDFEVRVCVTGQHREMLDQVLEFFNISADFDLNIIRPNQTLFDVTAYGLRALEDTLRKYHPDLLIVQGDTTSAFIGALAGFYSKVKIAHVEAGLRTGNKESPYPEEVNRILIGHIADYHFAPTERAVDALRRESIIEHVYNVGNTVVDATLKGLTIMQQNADIEYERTSGKIDPQRRTLLVTAHRRENLGVALSNICEAIKEIVQKFGDVDVIFPMHYNPNVRKTVLNILSGNPRIRLIEPLPYAHLLWVLSKSHFVLTDSGGIQEEAPTLGKPVLVLRDLTERSEGIDSGNAVLVGTAQMDIVSQASKLLTDQTEYERMSKSSNPYGDGTASKQICNHLKKLLT